MAWRATARSGASARPDRVDLTPRDCRQSTPGPARVEAARERYQMAVGFGLIGSGMMGRTYEAGIHRQAKDARVIAVAGGSRAPKLAAEFGIADEPTVDAL